MRLLIAILGLLLCLVATKADELTVIKDSEAAHYVGRYVEVRGFVVSVTTSPLGTAFINHGRGIPKPDVCGARFSRLENCDRPADRHAARKNRRNHRHD